MFEYSLVYYCKDLNIGSCWYYYYLFLFVILTSPLFYYCCVLLCPPIPSHPCLWCHTSVCLSQLYGECFECITFRVLANDFWHGISILISLIKVITMNLCELISTAFSLLWHTFKCFYFPVTVVNFCPDVQLRWPSLVCFTPFLIFCDDGHVESLILIHEQSCRCVLRSLWTHAAMNTPHFHPSSPRGPGTRAMVPLHVSSMTQ